MKHEDKIKLTQDAGNGNPPPKKPPVTTEPQPETFTTQGDGTGESSEDAGNGNPPPKG